MTLSAPREMDWPWNSLKSYSCMLASKTTWPCLQILCPNTVLRCCPMQRWKNFPLQVLIFIFTSKDRNVFPISNIGAWNFVTLGFFKIWQSWKTFKTHCLTSLKLFVKFMEECSPLWLSWCFVVSPSKIYWSIKKKIPWKCVLIIWL